jgi:hypothetical protein
MNPLAYSAITGSQSIAIYYMHRGSNFDPEDKGSWIRGEAAADLPVNQGGSPAPF